ncbi:MAG: hypothetical protein LBD06_03340 [Candidatus Accumulibacter sp.]|nr:hypothetical protein [Accumulibacter sp.]
MYSQESNNRAWYQRTEFRGQSSEDRSLRGQKTDQLAALRAVQRTENRVLGFKGQRFENSHTGYLSQGHNKLTGRN